MEENDVAEVETNDTEATAENASPNTESKPAGYHPVDLSGLPEDLQGPVKERFDYLYSQVKRNDRVLNDYRTIAQQQSKQIEDLMNGMGQVVDHMHNSATKQSEAQIRYEMKEALAAGDNDAYVEAQVKLMDLKYGQKQAPQVQQPQQQRQSGSIYQVGQEAAAEGEITPQELQVVEAWQDESVNGVPLRPWARAEDPRYEIGLRETMAVFTNPSFSKLSVDQKLQEVDRRMGVKKQQSSQAVLGGNLTTRQKTTKVNMTPKQQEIAVKMKFGGAKAKSDADHIEAYRKQIEKSQQRQRSH